MVLRAPTLPFSLDPVIAEAKRRARRRRSLVALLVLLLLGGALGGVLATRPSGGPHPTGNGLGRAESGTAGQVAPTNAHQLLNDLVLPAGAQRLRVAPRGDGGLLRQAQSIPGASQLTDLHRIWRVHKAYSSTTSFVESHLPRGAQGQGRGEAGGPGIPYDNEDDTYSLPTEGRDSVFWLDLTFVGLPHGWTGIRADALIGSCPCFHH